MLCAKELPKFSVCVCVRERYKYSQELLIVEYF